jgi:WD40 repeat protein
MSDSNKTTLISRPNPYVGPRAFKTGEKLYGRDRETAELLDLIIAERIVLLYSPSGAGKSSLLNAALIPELEKQGFVVLPPIRVNQEPPPAATLDAAFNRYVFSAIASIENDVSAQNAFSDNELATLRFAAYIQKYRERTLNLHKAYDKRTPFVLLFDQMEEILTLNPTDREAKQEFFSQIGECLRDRGLYALFALREDYVAGLDPYLRPVPTRLGNRYRLDLLSAEASIQAIREPSSSQGVDFELEAARKLTDELRRVRVQNSDGTILEQPGLYVEPVQLQVVCRRLWTILASDTKQVTLTDVANSGDIDTALSAYYSNAVAITASETETSERAIREWVNNHLITVQGLRGQVQMAPEASEGLKNDAIWFLEKLRIVRAEKRGGITWFELAHDRLIEPVRNDNERWFNKNLNLFQRQADLWNQQERPDGLLLSGMEYLAAEKWAAAHRDDLLSFEREFFAACEKAHAATVRERRNNTIIRWLFIASVLTSIVAGYFFFRAAAAERLATAREYGAQAKNVAENNPELSILLALQSIDETGFLVSEAEASLRLALPSMRVNRLYEGHTDKVYSVVFSPDGTKLASASNDGTAKVWDIESGEVIREFKVDAGLTYAVFNPSGTHLSISTKNGHILTFDVADGTPIHDIEAHDGVVWWLAYSPDGSRIASAGADNVARVWDSVTCELLLTLEGHLVELSSVAYSPDGTKIATASYDQTVRIWDSATGELLFRLTGHSGGVTGVAFSPDGTRLATACTDRFIRMWDMATGELLMSIPGHRDWVYSIVFTKNGSMLFSTSSDRTIRSWDTTYGRPDLLLRGHSDQVFSVAISPDENFIATASQDATVRLWDISKEGSFELFTIDYHDRVFDLSYAPDGTRFAAAGRDQLIHIWDSVSRQELLALEGHERIVQAVDFSPDSSLIASGSQDTTVRIWDSRSGAELKVLDFEVSVNQVAFSGDGTRLVAGGGDIRTDGRVMVWDVASGQVLYTLGDETSSVYGVDYSPDNRYFAASYYNGSIQIWDARSGKLIEEIVEAHSDIIRDLAFSPDSRFLASASDDGSVTVWDMSAEHFGEEYSEPYDLASGTLDTIAWSPDSLSLVTGGIDGIARFWELDTFDYHALYGNVDRVFDAAFSPDGGTILTAGADGTVRGFVVDNLALEELARERLLRPFSDAECNIYHIDPCEAEVAFTPQPLQITAQPVLEYIPNTFTPTPTKAPQIFFTPSPPPTPTPVFLGPPTFVVTTPAYCRTGPGPGYEIVTSLRTGDTAPIIGASEPGLPKWWVVTVLDNQCWVYSGLGETTGDLTGIPVYRTPPTPFPTRSP